MTIGLIAHDAKKKLMQNFCIAYRGILSKHTLYATGIFPNTGLPLPFISYGSSSLISIFIGMGLVLNAGLQRVPRHY